MPFSPGPSGLVPSIPFVEPPVDLARVPLRVLIVDDSEDDAALLLDTVQFGGFEVSSTVVDSPAAMRSALERQEWDVITSDHSMARFSAPAALALAQELSPHTPFLIVSGEIDLDLAVSLMKDGAQDYVQKRDLPHLVPAISRALREGELRRLTREARAALVASETRYRRLFETAQDGILILDADTGRIQDVNPFLTAMLGYSKDDFLGKRLWEIGAVRDKVASQAAFEALQADGYVRYEDLPLQTSDGRQIEVEFVSNVYPVDHTRVAQCNIRNVTDRKKIEADIRKLHEEVEERVVARTRDLESVNRELETFNYAVSHDLRAPLRAITGFVSLMKEVGTDEEKAGGLILIEKVRVAVGHMNSIISALLELARLSRKVLTREMVDLSALARHVAAELRGTDPTRHVEFVVAEGVAVLAAPPLLSIVLENLLGNAWKFTGRKGSARIEFGSVPQADGLPAYFVRDDGIGFDMARSERLFGAFQRLHGDEESPGTGIGLATVQRIVHRHGGRVWAEASVGKGATFTFTLAGERAGLPRRVGSLRGSGPPGPPPQGPSNRSFSSPRASRPPPSGAPRPP